MKITDYEIFPIGMPYAEPYVQATGITKMARRVVLKLHTDEGIIGLGDASTLLPNRTGETAEVIAVVLKNHLCPLLIGEDPLQIQNIDAKLRTASMEKYNTFLYSKAAIDIALHDIQGKAYNVPVAYLLGGIARTSFGVSRSVPMVAPEVIGDIAKRIVDDGYKLITIKTGIEPDLDLARVKAVRKAVGDEFPLEVDCNMGYLPDVAIQYLSQMEDYGVIAVEQPGPWWDLDGMAEVTRALKMSVMADESVLSEVEAMNAIRRKACNTVCIKVAKNGGLAPAKRIANLCGAAAMAVNMGSEHPAGIGTAAMAHFWASTPQLIDSVGYGSPLERFTDDIVKEPIKFKDGVVHLPEGPGLGVELDEDKLDKWRIQIDLP